MNFPQVGNDQGPSARLLSADYLVSDLEAQTATAPKPDIDFAVPASVPLPSVDTTYFEEQLSLHQPTSTAHSTNSSLKGLFCWCSNDLKTLTENAIHNGSERDIKKIGQLLLHDIDDETNIDQQKARLESLVQIAKESTSEDARELACSQLNCILKALTAIDVSTSQCLTLKMLVLESTFSVIEGSCVPIQARLDLLPELLQLVGHFASQNTPGNFQISLGNFDRLFLQCTDLVREFAVPNSNHLDSEATALSRQVTMLVKKVLVTAFNTNTYKSVLSPDRRGYVSVRLSTDFISQLRLRVNAALSKIGEMPYMISASIQDSNLPTSSITPLSSLSHSFEEESKEAYSDQIQLETPTEEPLYSLCKESLDLEENCRTQIEAQAQEKPNCIVRHTSRTLTSLFLGGCLAMAIANYYVTISHLNNETDDDPL